MTDKVKLRKLNKSDTAISWRWRNQQAVKDHFAGHPFDVSREQEEAWFDKSVNSNESLAAYAIELIDSGQFVGITFLKNINNINRQAEFAILVDQEQAGKGFGKEACFKTLKIAFEDLNLHRVFLKVRKDNLAAIRIYEACGFKIEGELRDDVFKNDSFKDQFIMAILKPEFSGKL